MALGILPVKGGLSSGFYILLVKVGRALFKEPDLVCCDAWISNHRVKDVIWGECTSQGYDNQMGLREWKLSQWEMCRLPTSRAAESQETACPTSHTLIPMHPSPSPASQAPCLQEWRARTQKPPGSGFYTFPDTGPRNSRLHHSPVPSSAIPGNPGGQINSLFRSRSSLMSLENLKTLTTSLRSSFFH